VGTLKYDGVTVEFENHILVHIEVVAIRKLRKQEAFFMSWREPESGGGGGRTGIWVHPAAMLTFHYPGDDNLAIDKAWIERLTVSANSPAGMSVTDAQGQPLRSSDQLQL
jgi:hypothetical protein